jgi:hypothetical protein
MRKYKYYSKKYTLDDWFQYMRKYPHSGNDEYSFGLFRTPPKNIKHLRILPDILDKMIDMCYEYPDPQFMPFICIFFKDFYCPEPRPNLSTITNVASYMTANDPMAGQPVAVLGTRESLPYLFALCDYCEDFGEKTWLKDKYRVIYRRRLNEWRNQYYPGWGPRAWYEHNVYIFPKYYEFSPIHKNIDWENIKSCTYWFDENHYPEGWIDTTGKYIEERDRLRKESWQRRNEEDENKRHKSKKMRMLRKSKS